jgi:hypothetical protein
MKIKKVGLPFNEKERRPAIREGGVELGQARFAEAAEARCKLTGCIRPGGHVRFPAMVYEIMPGRIYQELEQGRRPQNTI